MEYACLLACLLETKFAGRKSSLHHITNVVPAFLLSRSVNDEVGFRSSVVNVLDYGAHGHGFKPVVGVFGELSFSSLSSVRRRGVDFKLCLRINIRYNAV